MADGMAGGRDSYHPALFNWFSNYFNWVLILFGLATHLSVFGLRFTFISKNSESPGKREIVRGLKPGYDRPWLKTSGDTRGKKQKYQGFHRHLRLFHLILKEWLWELGLRYLTTPPPTFQPLSWKRNFLKNCQIFHIKHSNSKGVYF